MIVYPYPRVDIMPDSICHVGKFKYDLSAFFSFESINYHPLSHPYFMTGFIDLWEKSVQVKISQNGEYSKIDFDSDVIRIEEVICGFRDKFSNIIKELLNVNAESFSGIFQQLYDLFYNISPSKDKYNTTLINNFLNFRTPYSDFCTTIDDQGVFSSGYNDSPYSGVINIGVLPKHFLTELFRPAVRVNTLDDPLFGFENPYVEIMKGVTTVYTPANLLKCSQDGIFRKQCNDIAEQMGIEPVFNGSKAECSLGSKKKELRKKQNSIFINIAENIRVINSSNDNNEINALKLKISDYEKEWLSKEDEFKAINKNIKFSRLFMESQGRVLLDAGALVHIPFLLEKISASNFKKLVSKLGLYKN